MKKLIQANLLLVTVIVAVFLILALLVFSDRAFSAYKDKFAAGYALDQDFHCNAVLSYDTFSEIDGSIYQDFFIPARMVKVSLYDHKGKLVEEIRYNNYDQTVDMVFEKPTQDQTYQLVIRVYSYWLISKEVYSADVQVDGADKCGSYNASEDQPCETTPDGASVSKEEAIELVRELPEIQAYITDLDSKGATALIEYSHDECNTYSIHVYEIKDNHTATFNWYDVDMYTGEVTATFDF